MLYHGRFILPLCLLFALFSAVHVHGQTAAEQLQRYIEEQQTLRERRSQLRSEIDEVSEAQENVQRADDSPEKEKLEEARERFLAASEAHEEDPDDRSEARLRNAEFQLHLAERRYQNANREVAELEERESELRSEELAVRDRIQELDSLIEEQRRRAEEEQQQQAESRRLQAELERERRERERAEREAAQLQTLLERNNPEPVVDEVTETEAAQEPAPEEEEPERPLELDRNFTLLTDSDQVEARKAQLRDRIGGRPSNITTNQILNVRHIDDGREVGRSSTRFRGLGNYQYQARVSLEAGENQLSAGSDRWTVRIPEELGGQQFVLLMNRLDTRNTRVVIYPVAWD